MHYHFSIHLHTEKNKSPLFMELSLSQLCAGISDSISADFSEAVWVRAEISELSVRNGHCYMELIEKDVFSNLIKNHYMGCCMAFRRELLKVALPFPSKIAMHDIWLGLNAACFYSTLFIPDKLVHYRRHGGNASPTADNNNTLSWSYRISYRIYLILQLLRSKYSLKMRSMFRNY